MKESTFLSQEKNIQKVLYLLCLMKSLYFCWFTLYVHISSNIFSFLYDYVNNFHEVVSFEDMFYSSKVVLLSSTCSKKIVCKLCIYVLK